MSQLSSNTFSKTNYLEDMSFDKIAIMIIDDCYSF